MLSERLERKHVKRDNFSRFENYVKGAVAGRRALYLAIEHNPKTYGIFYEGCGITYTIGDDGDSRVCLKVVSDDKTKTDKVFAELSAILFSS